MRTKYLIEVNYKSGIQKQFWVYDLTISDFKEYKWEPVDPLNKPILIGVDEIESVWLLGEENENSD